MKSKYRLPALLLCLLLVLAPAMAEDASVVPDETSIPTIPLPTAGEVAPEPMPEAVDAPIEAAAAADEVSAEVVEGVGFAQVTLPELTPAPIAMDMDYSLGVASGPDFDRGYAKLTGAATGYSSASPNAEGVVYLQSGVVYVSDRRASSASDRLRAHFDGGGETCSVWIDASSLRPMSEDEVRSFVSERSVQIGVRNYGGDRALPLDAPGYSSVVTYSASAQESKTSAPAMFVGETGLSLCVGETRPIGVSFSDGEGHMVAFSSEDGSIAAVSDDGRVTGMSAGSTHVHLKSEFGNEAIVEILVQE